MRRYGEAVRPEQDYRDRPGAYGLISDGARLLSVLTTVPWPECQLPGGGIDPGESPIQALHREALEETGWRIAIERKFNVYQRYCELPEYGFWGRKVCHIFVCRPVLRLGPPREADHEPIWLPFEAAADLLSTTGDRAMAAAFVASRRR